MSADSDLCAEVVWKIENFSYCWHEHKEALCSQVVDVPFINGTSWRLDLYPRGLEDPYHVDLVLRKVDNGLLLDRVLITQEFVVLDERESRIEGTIHSFRYSYDENDIDHITRLKRLLLDENKEAYMPRDVLTVRCKMYRMEEKTSESAVFLLCTHIPVKKCAFSWHVSEAFNPSNKSMISLVFPLEVKVKLIQQSYKYKKNVVVIINGDFKTNYSWKCLMRNPGTGKELELSSDTISCDYFSYKEKFELLPLFATTENYTQSKSLNYELKCVFGIVLHHLPSCEQARIHYERQDGIQITASEKQVKTSEISKIDKKINGNSLNSDILKIYRDELLNDFNVKVQNKSFPVHSLILAARSPVLKCMLDTNMKESIDKTLELDDLDESTVSQMLDYMYTDDPGELRSESALKLYYAGDKYDVSGLKKLSSSFLESNISCSTVCDVLELADRHQDEHLKSTAVKFISKNEIEMMTSDEFRNFSKRNPDLYIETTFSLANLKIKP